jgi:hypothetical protein
MRVSHLVDCYPPLLIFWLRAAMGGGWVGGLLSCSRENNENVVTHFGKWKRYIAPPPVLLAYAYDANLMARRRQPQKKRLTAALLMTSTASGRTGSNFGRSVGWRQVVFRVRAGRQRQAGELFANFLGQSRTAFLVTGWQTDGTLECSHWPAANTTEQ